MKINILGAYSTKFGELWNVSPRTLAKEAIENALKLSGLKAQQIDALFVGNMLSGILGNQANLGSLLVEELGVQIPAFRMEGACASGGLALHNAINSLKAGQYKRVLVLGIEKMTDHSPDEITSALMAAGSDEERMAGATFPGVYALMAQAYMQKYQVTEEELSSVSVKNHYHGTLNPKAQFQFPITVDQVMKSSKIADPLKLLDCSPISDGAAAIVCYALFGEINRYTRGSCMANNVDCQVYTVDQFCEAHGISHVTFYKLLQNGNAPKTFKIGRRRLITREAATAWRAEMETQGAA